jgi:hypothetical protein
LQLHRSIRSCSRRDAQSLIRVSRRPARAREYRARLAASLVAAAVPVEPVVRALESLAALALEALTAIVLEAIVLEAAVLVATVLGASVLATMLADRRGSFALSALDDLRGLAGARDGGDAHQRGDDCNR